MTAIHREMNPEQTKASVEALAQSYFETQSFTVVPCMLFVTHKNQT
jgi:hypothetical protein